MEHRFLARVRRNGTFSARKRLAEAPEWLSMRQVAVVLGCSKSTVRKQIQLGLLKAPRSRKRLEREQLRVPSESVRKFLYFCERMRALLLYAPLVAPKRGNVLDRVKERGLPMPYRSIPKFMTVGDAAILLRCSRASVLRLIHSGHLIAIRITPYRWRVLRESFRGLRDVSRT